MFSESFSIGNPISYHWCGKFKTPSGEWLHLTRKLTDYEIFFVIDGTLFIADEAEKYTVAKDEYLIMSPTEKQYGYAPSDCAFLWVHFSPAETSEKSIILLRQGTVSNMERIIVLINQLQDTDRRYHHRDTMDNLVTGLLLEVYNQIQTQQKGKALSSKTQLYQAILDYVSWNKMNRISVAELSAYFGYHVKYLSAVFKGIAGISLKRYILQEMMEHAKAELMNTNKTIAQIGYSIGYIDSHNFTQAFKNATGISPTEYRNSYIKLPKTP